MWIIPTQLLTAWNGSMATAETISESNELSRVCAASLLVRSKPTQPRIWSRKLKREQWTRFLSGRIVKPSHVNRFEAWWICSLQATRAKDSVQQASAKEFQILASYGLGLSGQLSLFAPGEFFLRTSLATSRLDSPQSSATWKQQVTEQRGEYSARRKLGRHTTESGCLSWATPKASDVNKDRGTHEGKLRHLQRENSSKELACEVAYYQNWPTPAARDWKESGTERAARERNTPSLPAAVVIAGQHDPGSSSMNGSNQELWQTPRANKVEGYASEGFTQTLCQQVTREKKPVGKKLNPSWVEQLMGIPVGWTAYACAETELCQQPQNSLTGF
jgi:hypothetical protein